MGALTLKSFPFEIRGWEIEKFDSFDPTDSFGSNTRVYINRNQIILIEPDFDIYNFNTWITDKARQFFDGVFKIWTFNNKIIVTNKFWTKLFYKIIKIIYIFEHCNKQISKNYFFTIIIGNLSFEILSFLIIITQNYFFIKLKTAENWKLKTDLESNFQLNDTLNKIKLNQSTLCLLISTNPRYEGYYLNLNLRQRALKNNFKCFVIGSLINLTFPIFFLGSNVKIIKTVATGNNFICQNFKFSRNPFLIYNNELSKRNGNKYTLEILKTLLYLNIFNKTWNGLNTLNTSLSDTGQFLLKRVASLKLKDLNNFSSLYFLNVTLNNISNLKRITELKLLKFPLTNKKKKKLPTILLDQNYKSNIINLKNLNKIITIYLHIPNTTFYESEETFINTEGFIKRTTKLISRKKTKNNWQILRKLLKHIKTKLVFLTKKENNLSIFNLQKFYNFKNFINFQYHAVQNLTHLNFYLNIKNKQIILNKLPKNFKFKIKKFTNTKLKYWLDDFYSNSKDGYSQNSVVLNNCSKILRLESTNFF